MEKTIVIGGGVGPMAGVELHRAIIENTSTDGTDQSHLEVLHLSRSFDTPDRREYLEGTVQDNPAEGMARTFGMADVIVKASNRQAVGGIPCSTFHAPAIYVRFLELIEVADVDIGVVNMIEETVTMIKQTIPHGRGIGLMTTTGARQHAESRGARRLCPRRKSSSPR